MMPAVYHVPGSERSIDSDRPDFLFVLEDILDSDLEITGDPESEIQRWDVLLLLDRKDGLAGDPDRLCQILLREVVHRAEHLDLILHRSPTPRISGRNRT